ncbi:MAG: hypothetical protein AB3K77_05715 [Methanosarcinaceae archaeon]
MYTVYIKAVDPECNVNVDNIEFIWNTENVVMVCTPNHYGTIIYKGKAINAEVQVDNVVGLIDSAKRESEKSGSPVLLDFSENIESPKATLQSSQICIY